MPLSMPKKVDEFESKSKQQHFPSSKFGIRWPDSLQSRPKSPAFLAATALANEVKTCDHQISGEPNDTKDFGYCILLLCHSFCLSLFLLLPNNWSSSSRAFFWDLSDTQWVTANSDTPLHSSQARHAMAKLQPRDYQLACLEKIKRENTIISMPTGRAWRQQFLNLRRWNGKIFFKLYV